MNNSLTQLDFFNYVETKPLKKQRSEIISVSANNGVMLPRRKRQPKRLPKHAFCVRCGETRELQTHHIQALMDGGANTLENTTTLCIVCHKEWHMIEIRSTVTFEQWLRLPSYEALLALFMSQWPSDLSQDEIKQGLIQSSEIIRSFRKAA